MENEKRLNLTVFRILRGLNQIEMAKICKVCLSTYNAIENGKQDGKLKFWNSIKNEYNLTGEQICKLQEKQ